MGTWTNNDGLYLRFGTNEATVTTGGSYGTGVAGHHVTEVVINDMTTLNTTDTIMANSAIIPSGVVITKVELLAETAATSAGAAILDVGLVRLDRSTEYDYDGLVAQLALSAINAQGDVTTLVQDSTGHGALVGTTTSFAGIVTASEADANAYTAGKLRIRVYWYKP